MVEVGGTGTLGQSMAALAPGGEIAMIGVLAQGDPPDPRGLMMTGGTLRGIFVGNVAMANELNAFIDKHGIKPVIGKTLRLRGGRQGLCPRLGPGQLRQDGDCAIRGPRGGQSHVGSPRYPVRGVRQRPL